MTEKIAIIAWGAMADVLYATPIVRHVRRQFPEADITWLIRDKFEEVVETNPDIDEVIGYRLPEGHASRQEAEHVMDRTIWNEAHKLFDRVFDLQYWPRYNNFYERPTEDLISLRARNAGLNPAAIVDRHVVMNVTAEDAEEAHEFAKRKLGKINGGKLFITVNHISYAASPMWSFRDYGDLVDELDLEHDVMCFFTGAFNEPIPEHCVDARGLPYRVWAALIAQSNLWLGLDSGAVALACASDTPIIKLHSNDFPLAKTGIKSMGLRQKNVLELCPAPNPGSMVELIVENMR
jgi:ADP-heptose:LPS heptosyltransferase